MGRLPDGWHEKYLKSRDYKITRIEAFLGTLTTIIWSKVSTEELDQMVTNLEALDQKADRILERVKHASETSPTDREGSASHPEPAP